MNLALENIENTSNCAGEVDNQCEEKLPKVPQSVYDLHKLGKPAKEIAGRTGYSLQYVYKLISDWKKTPLFYLGPERLDSLRDLEGERQRINRLLDMPNIPPKMLVALVREKVNVVRERNKLLHLYDVPPKEPMPDNMTRLLTDVASSVSTAN